MTDASSSQAALEAAVSAMTNEVCLYDVTIICTTDDYQAEYWTQRLSEGICRNTSSEAFPMVLAVSEDWGPGGAGNGLGTLYAFQKATAVAKERHGVDLSELLAKGEISAALYHTAGKGTRLAPLPASENNNKPGVKLPVCHKLNDGSFEPMTVLEAVVKQTGVYASSRKGRLSVFWGDQVFIPSAPYKYTSTHHADIMCTLLGDTAPTAQEWADHGLEKYGVIVVMDNNEAVQVEKVSHATAVAMLDSLGNISKVGPSLGSFSVSAALLQALCDEFESELKEKVTKFDTDPHFWMPLTLPVTEYTSLMAGKGQDEQFSVAHHERMAKLKSGFDLGDMGLFGAVDVGSKACWWDYGQLRLYSKNNLKLTEADSDADLLRTFMGVTDKQMNSELGDSVTVSDSSRLFSCNIGSGSIADSVLASVDSPNVEAKGAIIVNCTAKKIVAAEGAILYNLVDDSEDGIVAAEGDIMVSVMDETGESMILRSNMNICGGKAWKQVLDMNDMSFEQVHSKNKESNVSVIEAKRRSLRTSLSTSFRSSSSIE